MKYYKHRKLFLRLRGGKEQKRTGLNPPEPLWPAVSSQSQDWNWIHKTEPDTISPLPASLPPEVWHEGQEEGKKKRREEDRKERPRKQRERSNGKLSFQNCHWAKGQGAEAWGAEVGWRERGGMWVVLDFCWGTLHLITNLYIRTRRGESLHCWAFPIH